MFGCKTNCPGGDSRECPSGQICYFDTPCDARLSGRVDNDNGGGSGGGEVDDASTTTAGGSTQDNGVAAKPESSVVQEDGGDGASNFCGRTIVEAKKMCSTELHCPSGLNGEW